MHYVMLEKICYTGQYGRYNCHGIRFSELAPLSDALEEFATLRELEGKIVLGSRFKPLVEFHLTRSWVRDILVICVA